MDDKNADFEKVQSVKQKYIEALMSKANVVGVGIGFRQQDGERTDDIVLVVMVDKKIAASALAEEDLVPAELDGIGLDVQEVGQIRAEAQPGGHPRIE